MHFNEHTAKISVQNCAVPIDLSYYALSDPVEGSRRNFIDYMKCACDQIQICSAESGTIVSVELLQTPKVRYAISILTASTASVDSQNSGWSGIGLGTV